MKLSFVIFYVKNIMETILFYEKAFQLKTKFIHDSKQYAELETGPTTLAFAQHELAIQLVKSEYVCPEKLGKPISAQISFEPLDILQAYNTALAAGARSVSAPEIKPWNWECAMLQDIDGNLIELAKPVK